MLKNWIGSLFALVVVFLLILCAPFLLVAVLGGSAVFVIVSFGLTMIVCATIIICCYVAKFAKEKGYISQNTDNCEANDNGNTVL